MIDINFDIYRALKKYAEPNKYGNSVLFYFKNHIIDICYENNSYKTIQYVSCYPSLDISQYLNLDKIDDLILILNKDDSTPKQ